MSIKIPSKNIYGKNSSKIRDNFIDVVTANQVVIAPQNKYESPVYTSNFNFNSFDLERSNSKKVNVHRATGPLQVTRYSGIYYNTILYYKDISFEINKQIDNSYISKVYHEQDRKISWSIFGNLYEKDILRATIGSGFDNYESADSLSTSIQYGEQTTLQKKELLMLPEIPLTVEYTSKNLSAALPWEDTVTIDVDVADESYFTVTDDVDGDKYKIFGRILCGLVVEKATGYEETTSGTTSSIYMTGKWQYYEGEEAQVTVYGNTIGISLTNGAVVYGNGNSPYSIDQNELIQSTAKTYGISTTEYISRSILQGYKYGKETAVLKCSISDYFDENDELAISADGKVGSTPDRMTFQNGDEVIPMVCGADGKDRPLSQKNGEPKVFKVLGVKCFYDGAVWQEISLQEV